MDPTEKMVLRKRKLFLAKNLVFNNELSTMLTEFKLIGEAEKRKIKLENTNEAKICRLIDCLLEINNPDCFRQFTQAISHSHKWFERALTTDLLVEKHADVTGDTFKEARAIVLRRFGTGSRARNFKGQELQTLINIMAARIQMELVEANVKKKATDEEILNQNLIYNNLNTQISNIWMTLKEFCQKQQNSLLRYSDKKNQVRSIFTLLAASDKDYELILVNLPNVLSLLLGVSSKVLEQYEVLGRERRSCLRLLGVPEHLSQPLDQPVTNLTRLSINPDMEAEHSRVTKRRLARVIEDTTNQIAKMEIDIDNARKELSSTVKRCAMIRKQIFKEKKLSHMNYTRANLMIIRKKREIRESQLRRKTIPNIQIDTISLPKW